MKAEDIPAVAADGKQNVVLGEPFLQMVAPADGTVNGVIQFDLNTLPEGGLALFGTVIESDFDRSEDTYKQTHIVAQFPSDMSPEVVTSMIRLIAISEPTGGTLYDMVATDE